MELRIATGYKPPKQSAEEIKFLSDKLTLDIENTDEETAKHIYFQGMKDSVMILKGTGVI